MGDKCPEVTGCDASIMKNVWEIRLREHGQKQARDTERSERSALRKINADWQKRMTGKQKYPSRKPRQPNPVEAPLANNPSYMNKGNARLGVGASRGPSGFAASDPLKGKKGSAKGDTKMPKLMILALTQPAPMMWGKSWKFVKPLPEPVEGAEPPLDWGKSWMFAALQPYLEGKSWTEQENNHISNHNNANCSMWENSSRRIEAHYLEDSQHPEESQSTREWDQSWRYTKYQVKKEGAVESTEARRDDQPKPLMMLNRLAESQHYNKTLSSSEWIESWKVTRPLKKKADLSTNGPSTGPTIGPTNGPISGPTNGLKDGKQGSKFGESWKFINLQLHVSSSKSIAHTLTNPEWADSWKAAKMLSNNNHKTKSAEKKKNIYGAEDAPADSHLHKVILSIAHDQKYRDIWNCHEMKPLSDWENSWLVMKTKVELGHEAGVKNEEKSDVVETVKGFKPTRIEWNSGEAPKYEVLYSLLQQNCKMEKFLQQVKLLEMALSYPEWEGSWRSLKHQLATDRMRNRPSRSRPFREPKRHETPQSEWAESWRLTNLTLNQEPELWQQGWSTVSRARTDRTLGQTYFANVAFPRNDPIGGRGSDESWRFKRSHHRSEVPQQGTSSPQASTLPQRRRNMGDWGESWMVSKTRYRFDQPSMTDWLDSWRCSPFHTERELFQNCLERSMEIQPRREKLQLQSAQAKMSRCFESEVFNQRFPVTEWFKALAAPTFPCQQVNSKLATGSAKNNASAHGTTNNNVSRWGKSWRVANPMPCVDKPWAESSADQTQCAVLWSRNKCLTPTDHYANFNKNTTLLRMWTKSWRFLKVELKLDSTKFGKGKSAGGSVIIPQRVKTRKPVYCNIDIDKPSVRKWAACHLLAKTQPRPKRGASVMKSSKAVVEEDHSFYQEWMESWRYTNKPTNQLKASPAKSLLGWEDFSWKFLIDQYPQQNSAQKIKAQ